MRCIAAIVIALVLSSCGSSDQSVGVDNNDHHPVINAFAFGYFSGLTLSLSNVFAGLMDNGQVSKVRADRIAHPDADDFGRIAGFATLLVLGWRVYRRRQRREEGE